MTWKGRNQSNGRWQSWQDWKSDQGQEKEKDKKKKEPSVARSQKSEVLELISYDGKRVALPDDKGAGGSSSASSSGLQEENKRLKDALKYFANKKEDEEVPEDYRPFLHEDPRESLRVQQRELNKQKKMIGRVEKIRSTMEEKSQRWVRWKARILRGLELEEQRYKEEYKQLEDELQAVETGKEVPMDLENVGTDGHGGVEDELTEVKHQVGQMADYMQRIEKRNLDLTLQVQDLITAVREAKQCDVLQPSPQKPIRGSGFTLPIEVLPSHKGDKSRSSSKERSRSPCRVHEEPTLKLTEVVKEAGLEHLLAGMSPEHHDHLMAIITSEPANFQNPKQVQELIHTMMTQQLAEQTAVMDAGLEDPIKNGRRDVLKPFGLPRERSAKRPGIPLSERTANAGDHRRVSSRSVDSTSHMSSME